VMSNIGIASTGRFGLFLKRWFARNQPATIIVGEFLDKYHFTDRYMHYQLNEATITPPDGIRMMEIHQMRKAISYASAASTRAEKSVYPDAVERKMAALFRNVEGKNREKACVSGPQDYPAYPKLTWETPSTDKRTANYRSVPAGVERYVIVKRWHERGRVGQHAYTFVHALAFARWFDGHFSFINIRV